MRYEYSCSVCEHIQEEVHSYLERPLIKCNECGCVCDKLISQAHYAPDKTFEFTDYNTTGKAVEIKSKGQWQRHLKKLGMHDDIPQRPLKEHEVKKEHGKSKYQRRKEIKEALVSDLQSVGKIGV